MVKRMLAVGYSMDYRQVYKDNAGNEYVSVGYTRGMGESTIRIQPIETMQLSVSERIGWIPLEVNFITGPKGGAHTIPCDFYATGQSFIDGQYYNNID